jgi:hypothetical protein
MRNLECSKNASGCLRKTNTTTKGCLYPDAAKIVAAGTVRATRTGTLAGVFKMRSAAVLGRSRDLSTGGFRRFLTASPFGDWLRPRTGALPVPAPPAWKVLDNPARRSKVKAMNSFVPPGGATGLGAGPRERNLCRERFRSHNQTIGNHDDRKRNPNPFADKMAYPPFSSPNIC